MQKEPATYPIQSLQEETDTSIPAVHTMPSAAASMILSYTKDKTKKLLNDLAVAETRNPLPPSRSYVSIVCSLSYVGLDVGAVNVKALGLIPCLGERGKGLVGNTVVSREPEDPIFTVPFLQARSQSD